MKERILIVGAGGHARSVADIALESEQIEIAGFIDNKPGNVLGIPVIGNDDDLEKFYESGIKSAFIAIGENKLRSSLFFKLKNIGFNFVNIISSNSHISRRAVLGTGICVMAGAAVNVNTVIEDNCIINTNCCIDHDCKIGRDCHIAPGVAMSGTVTVGDGTHIGTGSNVIDGISIGSGSYIGAGAAVVKDIPERVMAYGVPARVIRNL